MAEFLYRVKGDKAAAKEWFDKAIAIKENQIDTLYFLSRYDLETGNKEAALEKLEKALGGRFSPLNYCNPDMIREEIEQLKGAL
jgi:tetratricopeptide (TPR) repeat protein